jgi:aminoglycoside phosphotransferase (APT) family kinase protein
MPSALPLEPGSELPGMNLPALRQFLVGSGVSVSGNLGAELLAGGRSNLTFKVVDDHSQWVVRRPPHSGLTPSAHDMAREWTVTHALQASEVPVARTVAMSTDPSILGAPFTVVEYVSGRVIRDQIDLATLSDKEVQTNSEELIRILAALHAVDYQAVGLTTFGKPGNFLARQIKLWIDQWQRVKTRELTDVSRLHAALLSAIPAESSVSVVHGDYRVDNVIIDTHDAAKVNAVVDWEMSTLGDPLTDVALMCVYREPIFDALLGMHAAWTSPRYPSADRLAHLYAEASGRNLTAWNFYTALANFKLGVIGEGITHRALQGSDTGNGAVSAAEATHEFMAAGLHALAGRH